MSAPKLTGALVIVAGASFAYADMPKVLDRVPKDAAIIATIENIGAFETKLQKWSDTMGIFEDAIAMGGENPLEDLKKITRTPGLNNGGSFAAFTIKKTQAEIDAAKAAAAAGKAATDAAGKANDAANADPVMTDEEFEDEINQARDRFNLKDVMDSFMLVPVSDYNAFVTGLGAASAEGVQEVTIEGEQTFVSNAGEGYALLSDGKASLERLLGNAPGMKGNMATFTTAMGANGAQIAADADAMVIANVPILQKDIMDAMQKMQEEAGNQMIPGMDQAAQALGMFKMLGENFARDASVGVLGVGLGEGGLWIDLGSQFRAGTELAGLFQDKGDTNRLLARVPQQEFFVVSVMDTAAPGIKKMLGEYTKMTAKMMEEQAQKDPEAAKMAQAMQKLMGPFTDMTAYADKTDGYAMVMGSTPGGLMGGLFVNTIAYSETRQPQFFADAMKKTFDRPEGEKLGPVTIKPTFRANAEQLAGISVDRWGMQIQADPNDPEGTQVAMMSGFIFGPRGLGGYIGQTDSGFVTSYSDNKLLMTNALEVAKSGKGLALDADMVTAQSVLPKDRTMEFHLGVKPILETVQGFAGMMGGGADWQVPERVSPISMGATTHSGGMHARIYVPNDVMTALKDMAKAFEGMGGNDMMGEDEPMDGESPDF